MPQLQMTKNEARELIENMSDGQRRWFFANLAAGGGGGGGKGGGGKGGKGKAGGAAKKPSVKVSGSSASELDSTYKSLIKKRDAAKSKGDYVTAGKLNEEISKTAKDLKTAIKSEKNSAILLPGYSKPTKAQKEWGASKTGSKPVSDPYKQPGNEMPNVPSVKGSLGGISPSVASKMEQIKADGSKLIGQYGKASASASKAYKEYGPDSSQYKAARAKVEAVNAKSKQFEDSHGVTLDHGTGRTEFAYGDKDPRSVEASPSLSKLATPTKAELKKTASAVGSGEQAKKFHDDLLPLAKADSGKSSGLFDEMSSAESAKYDKKEAQAKAISKGKDLAAAKKKLKVSEGAQKNAADMKGLNEKLKAVAAGSKPSIGDLVGGFNPGAAKTIGDKTSFVKTTFAKGDHTKFRNAMKEAGYSTMPGKTANETLHKGPSGDIVRIKKGPNGSTQVEQIVTKGAASAPASSQATPAFQTKVNGKWVDGLYSTGKQTTEASLVKDLLGSGDAKTMKEAKMMAADEMKSFNADVPKGFENKAVGGKVDTTKLGSKGSMLIQDDDAMPPKKSSSVPSKPVAAYKVADAMKKDFGSREPGLFQDHDQYTKMVGQSEGNMKIYWQKKAAAAASKFEELTGLTPEAARKKYSPTTNTLQDDHVGSSVVRNQRRANMAKFTPQEREEVLDGLVGNCSCEATAKADRASLNALSDQALARLALNAGLGETDDLVDLEQETVLVGNSEPMTANEWLASAPPEVQSVVRNAMAQEKKEKTDLVATITANSRNVFSDKQLMAKSIDELRGLAALAGEPTPSYRPAPNYAGASGYMSYGQHVANASGATKEEPLMAPTMNFLDEDKAE